MRRASILIIALHVAGLPSPVLATGDPEHEIVLNAEDGDYFICDLLDYAYPSLNGTQKQIVFGGYVACSGSMPLLEISVTLERASVNPRLPLWSCSHSRAFFPVVNCQAVWPADGTAPFIDTYRTHAVASVKYASNKDPVPLEGSTLWRF